MGELWSPILLVAYFLYRYWILVTPSMASLLGKIRVTTRSMPGEFKILKGM